MADALSKGRHDTLLDWLGASFPAACAGYAAIRLAPLFEVSALLTALGASATLFVIAFAFMHSVKPKANTFAIPASIPGSGGDGELVLDRVWREVAAELDELLLDRPLVETRSAELAELLLDDALNTPDPDSRVVQLFAPNQLKERIDRHLANARGVEASGQADASDALSQALAELKLSLHQA